MDKAKDFFNKDSEFGRLPPSVGDDSKIETLTRWINVGIFSLSIVATILYMIDTTECFYLGIMNGVVEIIGVLFMLVTELPTLAVPDAVEKTLKTFALFLYTPIGRLAFSIYLALMLYGFSTFGGICGFLMCASTLFSVYLYLKYPGTRKEYRDLEATTVGP